MSDQPLLLGRDVGNVADPRGRFFTPPQLARVIVAEIHGLLGTAPVRVTEPHVGDGSLLPAIRQYWPKARVQGVDIDPEARGLRHCDTAVCDDWLHFAAGWRTVLAEDPALRPDAVLGNPPFDQDSGRKNADGEPIQEQVAHLHVEAALALDPGVLAFILPWSYAGGLERWATLLAEHPPAYLRPIAPRPWGASIRETALYLWIRGYRGETIWKPLPRWKP